MNEKIKNAFESIELPNELNTEVDKAIYFAKKNNSKNYPKFLIKSISTATVACFVLFCVLLNTTTIMAKAYEIPIIGTICKIFTFKEYDSSDYKKNVTVKIPNIENTGNTELENRINMEIRKMMDDEIKEAEKNADEMYEAYISTGGDPKEYMPHEISINYEIMCQKGNMLSFTIDRMETRASAYQETRYYNIDLESGKKLTLRDIFGTNFKDIVTQKIQTDITNLPNDVKFYLFEDTDIYSLIDEKRGFYIDENEKNAVVVFNKYEIAAGAAGRFEFVIPMSK